VKETELGPRDKFCSTVPATPEPYLLVTSVRRRQYYVILTWYVDKLFMIDTTLGTQLMVCGV